jgi:hypothetical protein
LEHLVIPHTQQVAMEYPLIRQHKHARRSSLLRHSQQRTPTRSTTRGTFGWRKG